MNLPPVEACDRVPERWIPAILAHVAAIQGRLAARLATGPAVPPSAPDADGFLPLPDAAKRSGLAEQTIRNLVSSGAFRRGVHYHKPRGKLLFDWRALREWITQAGVEAEESGGGGK